GGRTWATRSRRSGRTGWPSGACRRPRCRMKVLVPPPRHRSAEAAEVGEPLGALHVLECEGGDDDPGSGRQGAGRVETVAARRAAHVDEAGELLRRAYRAVAGQRQGVVTGAEMHVDVPGLARRVGRVAERHTVVAVAARPVEDAAGGIADRHRVVAVAQVEV